MLPTKWTIGLRAVAALIALLPKSPHHDTKPRRPGRGADHLAESGREAGGARLQAMAEGSCRDPDALRGALRPEDKRWHDWIKGQTKKIEGVLAHLEAEANLL
jgi:hypothetical protein